MTLPPPRPTDLAAAPSSQAVIELSGVSKVYGDQRALDGIDLVVPRGSIVGLIGPSGCGKTTLVKVLTGIAQPTTGDVRVLGMPPAEFDTAARRRFGYMPQLPVLFPNLTVWGNLGFVASVYGMSLRRRRRRLKELLDFVDLGPHRHKRLSQCSGGMQRRLALAATLVHDPELLFLDEPTAGVDPILRERFWQHFRSLRDEGRTIVVPTQYVGEAVSCDLVAVMATGRLLTVLPPDELGRYAYGGTPLAVDLSQGWVSGPTLSQLGDLPFVREVIRSVGGLTVVVDDAAADGVALRRALEQHQVGVSDIGPLDSSFDDLFVRIIETHTTVEERAAA